MIKKIRHTIMAEHWVVCFYVVWRTTTTTKKFKSEPCSAIKGGLNDRSNISFAILFIQQSFYDSTLFSV